MTNVDKRLMIRHELISIENKKLRKEIKSKILLDLSKEKLESRKFPILLIIIDFLIKERLFCAKLAEYSLEKGISLEIITSLKDVLHKHLGIINITIDEFHNKIIFEFSDQFEPKI